MSSVSKDQRHFTKPKLKVKPRQIRATSLKTSEACTDIGNVIDRRKKLSRYTVTDHFHWMCLLNGNNAMLTGIKDFNTAHCSMTIFIML